METNIFPHTACLVARPNSGITLCACPTVQRDNERTCIISIVRHNTAYVSHTVQPEGVSGTYPRYVCFQYTHACITHLFHNITLQQSTYAFLRMQVWLCPKSDLHSVLTGIISQTFQVGNVTVQRFGLSVSCTVTVVGKQPAEGHVMALIAVDHCTSGELIVVLFTVQRFFDTTIVFLTFFVAFSIFKKNSFFIFFPIVTVVGIQMSFVKTKFGE